MTDSSKKRKKRSRPSVNKLYYPVFLDIADRECLIIGGGKVAERKCQPLLAAGAKVTVISPKITSILEKQRDKGVLRHLRRNYRTSDIKSAFVVIVATDSEEINRKVACDAEAQGVLLNVVDNPPLCNFIVPSVLKRGNLTIAVSTGGVSPAMARIIRRRIELQFGPEFSRYLRFLKDLRKNIMKEIQDKKERGFLLKELASDRILQELLSRRFQAAKEAALRCRQARKVIS